jgi:hypothetical protein
MAFSFGWLDLLAVSYTLALNYTHIQAIQRYCRFTLSTVHRYTHTRVLCLHLLSPSSGSQHKNYNTPDIKPKSGLLFTRTGLLYSLTFTHFTLLHSTGSELKTLSPNWKMLTRNLIQLLTFHAYVPSRSLWKQTSVSPINPRSHTRKITVLWTFANVTSRGCVTSLRNTEVKWLFLTLAPSKRLQLLHSNKRGVARRGEASRGWTELDLAQRKHRFFYCCVIAGTYFENTFLAWSK